MAESFRNSGSFISDMEEEGTSQRGANPSRNTKQRRALGRGLSSLLSVTSNPVPVVAPQDEALVEKSIENEQVQYENEQVQNDPLLNKNLPTSLRLKKSSSEGISEEGALVYLAIDSIFANSKQPRKEFSQAEIESLSQSIRESGLLQPIIVRRRQGDFGPLSHYEIVAGERRWRAAKLAGLSRVPAVLRSLSDRETLELSIVENVQRSDLNAIEEAEAYRRLASEFSATQEEIAKSVGKDRTSVANALRLLKLSKEVQEMLIRGEISSGHGRALLAIEGSEAQILLARRVVSQKLSVRQLEAIVRNGTYEFRSLENSKSSQASASGISQIARAFVSDLENRLRRALGTKVSLSMRSKDRGEIRITFFSREELDSILDKLKA